MRLRRGFAFARQVWYNERTKGRAFIDGHRQRTLRADDMV